jgi:hypothetical protein
VARAFFPLAVIIFPLMGTAAFLLNTFGMDGDGFRTFLLLPTRRDRILSGRNLALMPLALGPCLLFLVAGAVLLQIEPLVIPLTLILAVQAYLMLAGIGNAMSILFPYPVSMGLMRQRGRNTAKFVSGLVALPLICAALLPAAFCCVVDPLLSSFLEYSGRWVGMPLAVLFLAVTILAYRLSLPAVGRLMQRREKEMLVKLVARE